MEPYSRNIFDFGSTLTPILQWALPPKIYMAHLSRPGEELAYGEDGELLESKLGEPSKTRLHRIEHFQPKRTHEIGYDSEGKVTDWVSVWMLQK